MKRFLLFAMLLATAFLGAKADVDPNFYIYICFGQSNMEGNAQPESIDNTGIDNRFRLLATCNFSNPSRKMGTWYKATPPLVSPNGGLGPTDYFGRMMCENLPEEIRIGVIPVAMGGSPIEMFDKDKYQQKMEENPNEWWTMLANNHYGGNPYGRIIEMAKKAQEVGVIKGILLHQGCSNNGDSNWPNMVKKIYNDMLTDLGLGADSVPLFVGETLYENQGGSCYAHNTQVARMPSVVKTSHVISSEGCPGNGVDPWHFNALGYRILGSRYAAEGLYTLGKQYPYFSFHNYDLVANKNCSFTEKTRTMTVKSTGAGIISWTYPHFADWSGYKFLVVKLKEQQTIDAEVWLYGKSKNVSYRDTINDRTTIVIDLHNLKYGKTVMDPSKVYKMAFRAPKAGKLIIDDVFLTNSQQYDQSVDIHDFEETNEDGVTIYYTYINNNTELAVSYRGSYYNSYSGEYTGNVVIPESVTHNGTTYYVTSIRSSAFSGCSGLTNVTIPNTITSIGDYAFQGCSGLTSVTIPNSVTSIEASAFYGCSSLKELIFEDGTERLDFSTSDANSTFHNCPIELLHLGRDINYTGVPFRDKTTIKTLIIGDNVTSISNYMFSGCSGLSNVTIPNSVTSIGSSAFSGCSLKSVTIGAGVLSIGSSAFGSPTKVIWLTNTPPSGYSNAAGTVNYVANDLYSFSNRIKTVYKFLSSTFEVDGVKYVPVSPSERTCDAIDCLYDESAEHIRIGETVSYKGVSMNVQQVHPYACYQNTHIKDVELRNSGPIGNNAFQLCTNLESALICNIGAIGNYAFQSCTSLESAQISNIGPIGNNAFQSCSALQTATLGEQITDIGNYVFDGCNSLQSIVIPDAVTSIGSYAFQNCSMMESAKIGSSVETIGTYAFNNCSSLPVIEIPQSVTKVNNNVFDGCTALKDVYIADRSSILTLGYHYYSNNSSNNKPLFANCPLDSVYIGGNISYGTDKYSGYSPFYRNTSLRSVRITDEETEISENEFYGCTNLKNVWIGDGVTTIGNWAFSGCANLDYFAFGTSMETIGQEAFSDCVQVTKVISRAPTPPTCGSQALDDISKWTCTLEVPKGTLAAYQNADQWKEFFFMEEGAPVSQKEDLDSNGAVDESDVILLINNILGKDSTLTKSKGDLNNDGNIDMTDVTLLIDYILGKK